MSNTINIVWPGTPYTQTWSDVEARIGSQAKAGRQIAVNFNTLIMLRVKEFATAERRTSQLPEVRVASTLLSSSVSDTNDPGDFARRNEDRITTESEMLPPSDLVQLPKGRRSRLSMAGSFISFACRYPTRTRTC